jgi:hypothetical protein
MSSIAHRPPAGSVFTIPRRKESYTTWLYLALAAAVATLTVFGMWYAGLPRAMP